MSLLELRERLSEILETAIIGNHFKTLTHAERTDLLYYHRRIEKLVEAVYLMHGKRQPEVN